MTLVVSEKQADDADRYKFRTPTLLNVEVTGPWGHAGAYTTLENMVTSYAESGGCDCQL